MVSHGESWRDSCAARDVTDLAIGSSDWLGQMCFGWSLAISVPRLLDLNADINLRLDSGYKTSIGLLEGVTVRRSNDERYHDRRQGRGKKVHCQPATSLTPRSIKGSPSENTPNHKRNYNEAPEYPWPHNVGTVHHFRKPARYTRRTRPNPQGRYKTIRLHFNSWPNV